MNPGSDRRYHQLTASPRWRCFVVGQGVQYLTCRYRVRSALSVLQCLTASYSTLPRDHRGGFTLPLYGLRSTVSHRTQSSPMKEATQEKSVEVFSVYLFLTDRQNQPRRVVACLGFSSPLSDFGSFSARCDPSGWGDSQYILIVVATQRRWLAICHDCGDSQKIV